MACFFLSFIRYVNNSYLENIENENMYRWGIANCIIMEYGFGFMLCITMALKTIEPCNYNLLNGSRLYSDYNSFFV